MSSAISPRIFVLLLFAATMALLFLNAQTGISFSSATLSLARSQDRNGAVLPIPSRTYVISLPRRKDRYEEMERLRNRLGFHWIYIPAEDSQSPLVHRIMSHVRSLRQELLKLNGYPLNATITLPFEWPSATASLSTVPFVDPPPPPSIATSDSDASQPLTCATEDFTLVPYSPGLPEYKILSRSRIACWHSHFSVIKRTATQIPEKPSLILEDDVDMEIDIEARLLSVWSFLPLDWDVVFLGYCWSNESYYPALAHPRSRGELPTSVHPSRAPLCTHAYALSPAGARRLLLHLTHPRFAYSRAIDHALAWLVQSGRLNSFSVVPSLIVQRKVGRSDVMGGKGSGWRQQLAHGALAEAEGEGNS